MSKGLSPVSFAVLGQLAVREHSAYELVKLAPRWGTPFWGTAESVVYAELRHLESERLVLSKSEATGRRARTTYRIAATGRRRLAGWLATDPAPSPAIQFEAMLRVLFADHGTIDDIRRAVETVRSFALAEQEKGREIAAGYLDGTAPYPERTHIVALTFDYQWHFTEHLLRWADAADNSIATWTRTDGPQPVDLSLFKRAHSTGRPQPNLQPPRRNPLG